MTCPRMFQVEALRDGRLGGGERKSFERHLGACAACAREAAALDRLAEGAMTGLDDARSADDLHVWRERSRLLAAFDGALLSPNRRLRTGRLLFWPAAAVLIGALVVFGRTRPLVEPAHSLRATINADSSAVWSRRPGAGDREEVVLERGALWIHVDRAAGERRLVVLLPDGELEDVGTTFTVSADGEHTTRVAVEAGRVALRLRGRPPVDVGAGTSWLPDAPAVVPPAPAAPPPRGESPRERERSSPLRIARPLRLSQPSVAAAPDSLAEFRAASAALRAGDNGQAAAAFARFLAEHAADPMAEDAAYLRVIALQRMGAQGDMKRAANAYLERFPSGFRRAEVERLAR